MNTSKDTAMMPDELPKLDPELQALGVTIDNLIASGKYWRELAEKHAERRVELEAAIKLKGAALEAWREVPIESPHHHDCKSHEQEACDCDGWDRLDKARRLTAEALGGKP